MQTSQAGLIAQTASGFRASRHWRRTPSLAARQAARLFGLIVGERPELVWETKKGPRTVQLLRHLVAHFMREELGYAQIDIKTALGRHHSTILHSHLAVWRMREDPRVDALIARVRWAWVDTAPADLAEFRLRARAFRAAYRRLTADAAHKLVDAELAECLAAAADAAPIGEEAPALREAFEAPRPTTAVPVIDLHPAEAILSHAPAITKLIGAPAFEHAPTLAGGIRLSFSAKTLRERMESALTAAAAILDRAGFVATTDGVYADGAPRNKREAVTYRGVLRVAPARMVGIAAAIGLLFGGAAVPPDLNVGVELEAV